MDLFTAADVNAKRDAAMALHENKPEGRTWLDRARLHARAIAARRGKVTADDVRASVGDPPPECDSRIMGSVFKGKEFERVGYTKSLRGVNHGKMIAVFKLRGEA